jgi:hypothetical protein
MKLDTALKYRGPVRDLVDGEFPDEFVERVSIVKGKRHYSARLLYGAHTQTVESRHMKFKESGRVDIRFAAGLKRACNELYLSWLDLCGDITTEPPKSCPSDQHKTWTPYRTEAAFVPCDGHWRCLGCGWLLDSDGNRIHEQYSPIVRAPRGSHSRKSRRGHE